MLNNNWDTVLEKEYNKEYFNRIINTIKIEYEKNIIYPEYENIFKTFKLTDYNEVKVVILGQDPYHGEGEAQGLSFSVNKNCKRPPSLRNIFKELKNDLGIDREDNDLKDWSEQGVLLLNSVLTVKKDTPASHKFIGWEEFTDSVIKYLNNKKEPIVFILWGNFAKEKKKLITNKIHLILESSHPSPFSANRGFFGTKPFSKTNKFLKENYNKEIRW